MLQSQHMIYLWMLLSMVEVEDALRWRDVRYPAVVFQRDLREFMRRFTHQQPPHDTRSPLYSSLPRARESLQDRPGYSSYPSQSEQPSVGTRAFASSFSSVKRPFGDGGGAASHAVAFSALEDVNDEEGLAENIESLERLSTLSVGPLSSPTQEDKVTVVETSGESTGPYTSRQQMVEIKEDDSFSDVYFVAIVAGCCAAGIFGIVSAGFCFYRLQKSRKAAADVDYPAYGVTGPCKDVVSPSSGDRKLAQSAQMYHYQHQKQQMIAVEKAGSTKNTSASDVDSEEENEQGDYTVYECPGLAPTGEMEVKNPLFHDDSTPVSPPVLPKSDAIHNH